MARWLKKTPIALAFVGALALGACSDDGTGVDDDHGEDVDGFVLTLNGSELARYDGDTRTWSNAVSIEVGEETDHIDVDLVAEDGDVIVPDADNYLEVVVGDDSVAEFEQDTPGEFGGHIHGEAVGSTVMEFRLMHGAVGSGHSDFSTADLVVTVTPAPVV